MLLKKNENGVKKNVTKFKGGRRNNMDKSQDFSLFFCSQQIRARSEKSI